MSNTIELYLSRFTIEGGHVFYVGKDPETELEALDISIAKWTFIRDKWMSGAEVYADGGYESCGLCMMFYRPKAGKSTCEGCPVYVKTGQSLCHGTPYSPYSDAIDEYEADDTDISTERLAELANDELNFLIALREKYVEAHRG